MNSNASHLTPPSPRTRLGSAGQTSIPSATGTTLRSITARTGRAGCRRRGKANPPRPESPSTSYLSSSLSSPHPSPRRYQPTRTQPVLWIRSATIVDAAHGPRRHNRPWSELGLKRGFLKDLRLVWLVVAAEAVVVQLAPPTVGLAYVFGYLPKLVHHILGRVPGLGSEKGLTTLGGALLVMLRRSWKNWYSASRSRRG